MPENQDPSFESQLTWLNKDMYMARKEIYLEYVVEDYKFVKLTNISKASALALVNATPWADAYRPSWEVTRDGYMNIIGITNKGACVIEKGRGLWVYNFDGDYSLVRGPQFD